MWLIGRKQPDKIIFYSGLTLKVIAGIALGLIYKEYYNGGDTWRYYAAAYELGNLPFSEWWIQLGNKEIGAFENQPRAILFTKIVSGFVFLTNGDYWIVSAYLSCLSFLGYWFFYRQIYSTLPNIKWPIVIGFIFLPSTVFWSSGILKGVLTNASIVYISGFSLKLFYRKKIYVPEILITVLSLVLLYYIKYYLLIVLLPAVLYALFDRRAHRIGLTKSVRGTVYACIVLATILFAPNVNPNLRLSRLPDVIHLNQRLIQSANEKGSNVDLLIDPNWRSLATATPKALLIGLFGPTVFHSGSILSWVPRIENLVIFLLAVFSLTLLLKQKLWDPDILIMASIGFILILAILLPLAAPNFGTLIRYKAAFTPFLMSLVTILPCWLLQNHQE
jgi:hypothetical protein